MNARRPHGARSHAALAMMLGAAVFAVSAALPLAVHAAGGDTDRQRITSVEQMPEGATVVDIRSQDACLAASLPGARCLPAGWLVRKDGTSIGFHQLRWLLGTIGLTGGETVAVYGGTAVPDSEQQAAAALIYLAGQKTVLLLGGSGIETGTAGTARSLSREAIYTAPVRTGEMTIQAHADGTLRERLAAFSQTGGTAVFTLDN